MKFTTLCSTQWNLEYLLRTFFDLRIPLSTFIPYLLFIERYFFPLRIQKVRELIISQNMVSLIRQLDSSKHFTVSRIALAGFHCQEEVAWLIPAPLFFFYLKRQANVVRRLPRAGNASVTRCDSKVGHHFILRKIACHRYSYKYYMVTISYLFSMPQFTKKSVEERVLVGR